MPWYDPPRETPERKRRRLHLIATLGGSLAPKGTYGLPSVAQAERSRVERRAWSRRARVAWWAYWALLVVLVAGAVAGIAIGATALVVGAGVAVLLVMIAATAVGVRAEVRAGRRRAASRRGD